MCRFIQTSMSVQILTSFYTLDVETKIEFSAMKQLNKRKKRNCSQNDSDLKSKLGSEMITSVYVG